MFWAKLTPHKLKGEEKTWRKGRVSGASASQQQKVALAGLASKEGTGVFDVWEAGAAGEQALPNVSIEVQPLCV